MSDEYVIRAELAGVLPTPGWAVMLGEDDPSLQDLYFYVWVISNGTTTGLIDAGLPLDDTETAALGATNQAFGDDGGFRSVRTLPQILDEVGVRAEDVSFVAITQTVTYHSGGIDSALLPNAHFYLARAGVEEFLSGGSGHPAPEFYFTASSWASLRTLAIEGRLHLIDSSAPVAPGIQFEVTGGHHPGSAALIVNTPEGLVGVLETAFVKRNLETGRPIGIAEDIAAARAAMLSFQGRFAKVVAIHDPDNVRDFGGKRND
ncbi:hypothetical protein GCM10027022_11080 [Alpinimonas psychrophila]|uniref:Glyoxylase-like metal-dependent hydrolase (Beta-lactamase superfamily II) n=1 Tax=Alpinimonas psychrophila TaxID=748908 RepID=A0A7W3PP81_9MICO|nr:hypothetical protein [Alpinimonas psychrophila]MBA8828933.1 glyoxylase-like metal-dependent hydrolase (beta-lactamase superfamily II) [Alpinimonas psychrophila]